MPEPGYAYYHDFAAYLRTGDIASLDTVFPQAKDLSVAAVYRNGFLRACIEALRASYPVVEMLVGEDYFSGLAHGYVAVHPPKESSFTVYGKQFPRYLQQQLEQHQLAYLADFARLDQAWMRAYFAGDSQLLNEDTVESWQQAGNDIGHLHCDLPKSAELLTLSFEVSTLWLKLKSASPPDAETPLNCAQQRLLIWRDALDQINVRVVNPAEYCFLATLAGGNTLIAAATAAIEQQGDFPVIDYFSELLNNDVLASND